MGKGEEARVAGAGLITRGREGKTDGIVGGVRVEEGGMGWGMGEGDSGEGVTKG